MLRYCAACARCDRKTVWQGERNACEQEMIRHLQDDHQLTNPVAGADYHLAAERQCDLCLAPYLDDCTKCRRDFCREHAGDIDGLCGCCI